MKTLFTVQKPGKMSCSSQKGKLNTCRYVQATDMYMGIYERINMFKETQGREVASAQAQQCGKK